ncbi:MAG: holo-ACP synthase [Clostridia bacterium]
MIGVDIIEIDRIAKLINKDFLNTFFTDKEKEYIITKNNSAQTVAGLFSAKEAISKALGIGLGNGVKLNEMEIDHDIMGKPIVVLYGEAKEELAKYGKEIEISISHNKTSAIAFALIKV